VIITRAGPARELRRVDRVCAPRLLGDRPPPQIVRERRERGAPRLGDRARRLLSR